MMVNNGVIAVENVYRLAPFWPILLIAAGISLLARRIWWPLGALIWALLAGAVLWALIAAPGVLPAPRGSTEFRQVVLTEPVGQARSAEVLVDLSINQTRIHPLTGSNDLIVADIYVANEAFLDVEGTDPKIVRMRRTGNTSFNFFNFSWLDQQMEPWDIGLTTSIPLDLTIDASTGSTQVDLTGIQLQGLRIDASTGSMQVTLPEVEEPFPFRLNMSTGSMNISVPENTGFNMIADGSTGSLSIDVPDGAGLRVEVTDDGPGSVNLPGDMEKVSGGDGDEGVYENDAFATSDNPIEIQIDVSTGSFNVR